MGESPARRAERAAPGTQRAERASSFRRGREVARVPVRTGVEEVAPVSTDQSAERGEAYWRLKRRDRKHANHSGNADGAEAPEAPDSQPGGSASRPSKNNRQEGSHPPEPVEPRDLPGGTGLRPVSVEPGRRLRDEAVLETSDGAQARPWYSVVEEWRDWYHGYLGSHIEFENSEGDVARTALENSYMPEYGERYYAKLKDLERGVAREFDGMTTVMLTLTASHRNADGGWRCPADHMRDIMEGYDAARKQLHQVLNGANWEYARVWEPHADGYGHLHLAVFVEDGGRLDLEAGDFAPVMESHVRNCGPAGSEAHEVEGEDAAVSVNDNVENLGSYISEYIGIFGDETLSRPMKEQMFYAVTWATNTRRVDFSNGAQDIMTQEQFRRETGLRPEDRGGESLERWKETGDPDGDADDGTDGWGVRSICTVRSKVPEYADPTTGGVETTAIVGRSGVDPPPERA
jgi:hypothetical protein